MGFSTHVPWSMPLGPMRGMVTLLIATFAGAHSPHDVISAVATTAEDGRAVAAVLRNTLFVSRDGGFSWALAHSGLPAPTFTDRDHFSVAFLPSGASAAGLRMAFLYQPYDPCTDPRRTAGRRGRELEADGQPSPCREVTHTAGAGFYRSNNGGISWYRVSNLPGSFARAGNTPMICVTGGAKQRAHDVLIALSSGIHSYSAQRKPEQGKPVLTKRWEATDWCGAPTTLHEHKPQSGGHVLFAGTTAGCLLRSNDLGVSWAQFAKFATGSLQVKSSSITSVVAIGPELLLASTAAGRLHAVSTATSNVRDYPQQGVTGAIRALAATNTTVIVAGDKGAWRTATGRQGAEGWVSLAKDWQTKGLDKMHHVAGLFTLTQAEDFGLPNFSQLVTGGNSIFAATFAGVERSLDFGRTWTKMDPVSSTIVMIAAHVNAATPATSTVSFCTHRLGCYIGNVDLKELARSKQIRNSAMEKFWPGGGADNQPCHGTSLFYSPAKGDSLALATCVGKGLMRTESASKVDSKWLPIKVPLIKNKESCTKVFEPQTSNLSPPLP